MGRSPPGALGIALTIRPPYWGWALLLAGVLVGLLLESGTVWVTWRLCSARDAHAIARLQATADSVNAQMEECLRKSCIFPRDRRP